MPVLLQSLTRWPASSPAWSQRSLILSKKFKDSSPYERLVHVQESSSWSWAGVAVECSMTTLSLPQWLLDSPLSQAPLMLLSLCGYIHLSHVNLFSPGDGGRQKMKNNRTHVSHCKAYFSTSLANPVCPFSLLDIPFKLLGRRKRKVIMGLET